MGEIEDSHGTNEPVLTKTPSVDESEPQKQLIVQIPRVAARTITGPANQLNNGAIDWGYHGLLAYGSNYTVVVIDTQNIQPIQCLDKHKAIVNKVLWSKSSNIDIPKPRSIDLVSADTTGHIIIWDIVSAETKGVLHESSKPVLDLEWVPGFEDGDYFLAALHPPYSLVIWNLKTFSKLWKKTYTENLVSFTFNPFDFSKLAFLCSDCILFIDDFTLNKVPSSNGRKFYISTPRTSTNIGGSGSVGSGGNLSNSGNSLSSGLSATGSVPNLAAAVGLEEKQRARDRLRRLMKDLVLGETKPKSESWLAASECLRLRYHPAHRDHIILVYPREILLLDISVNQTVGIVPLDRSSSPLLQVIPTKQRDVLFCLHDSGTVSVKCRRRWPSSPCSPQHSVNIPDASNEFPIELCYDQRCQSESIRQNKGVTLLGITLDPICERRIALFVSTGRIVFLELRAATYPQWNYATISPVTSYTSSTSITLSELIPSFLTNSPMPLLKLPVSGLLTGTGIAQFTIVRMCPPLTTRNCRYYQPLLAAGTSSGVVFLFNMATGVVEKELAIHTFSVRAFEWISLTSFLSIAYGSTSSSTNNSNGLVRNELLLTDTRTGHSTPIRTDRGDESPIELLRVSPLKQYLVIVPKEGPFELWDLRNLYILRTMPKKFPYAIALEWSPIHNLKSLRRRLASIEEREQSEPVTAAAASGIPLNTSPLLTILSPTTENENTFPTPSTASSCTSNDKLIFAREHFVFSDSESQLYHFSVEGSNIKDGIKIPPEPGVGTVTCLAFKNEQIVQADADGLLSIWDLRARASRGVHTGRGWVRKMRFAPGKGNLKLLVLYSDGVDILDLKKLQYERIAQLKCPRDMVKIQDIDWAASDKPVLVTQDGCLRIMDLTLTESFSPLVQYEFQDPVYCPSMLPSPALANLQLLLSNQWWRTGEYTLDFNASDGFIPTHLQAVREQLSLCDEHQLQIFLKGAHGTAGRSLAAARLCGDIDGVEFWTVALYYLTVASKNLNQTSEKNTEYKTDIESLDTCYDILCDQQTFREIQLGRIAVHEAKASTGGRDHARRLVERLILLGETDRAVQLLLEMDVDDPSYYADAIKACLVATIQSGGAAAAQSTVKLVATNLIANGSSRLSEGVQLLCLINKPGDACRYLASYGLWYDAIWLARAVLPPSGKEAQELFRKWSDHLWSQGHKHQAVLVVISIQAWDRVLEMLGMLRLHTRAALFLQACRELGLDSRFNQAESLIQAVDLDLARTLFTLGNERGALKVCESLGGPGTKLAEEFRILAAEKETSKSETALSSLL